MGKISDFLICAEEDRVVFCLPTVDNAIIHLFYGKTDKSGKTFEKLFFSCSSMLNQICSYIVLLEQFIHAY